MSRSKRSTMSGGWFRIGVVSLGLVLAVGALPALGDDSDASDETVTAPAGKSDRAKRPQKMRREGLRGGPNPDKALERMTKELSLTEKQQAQVKEIMTAQKLKRDALREDVAGAGDREAAFQKMKDLRVETNGQIEAVLDDAQRKKYTAMISERRKRLEQMGGGGGRGGAGGGGGRAAKPPAN